MHDDVALILGTLPVDVAGRLAMHMAGDVRRHVRDRAIRDAFRDHYAAHTRTAAAKAMSVDLSTNRTELRLVLELNGGKPLAWRQIAEVLDEWSGW